jgi:hypothetical protein
MASRSGFGIGLARPPETKATRTAASTNTPPSRVTCCFSRTEAPFTSCGEVMISKRSLKRAALKKSICMERTTKEKPGASFSVCSNSAR